jgi:uncharacterized protein (DUF2252 family)
MPKSSGRRPAVPARLLTRAERHDLGKAARALFPREAHAGLVLPETRDALAVLLAQDRHRIPFLVPERHRRMAQDSFAYLRGAAAVMAADFKSLPGMGLTVNAAGDSHIMNFGSFMSPEGRILFDVNDFDETIGGVDFHVDVRRLAASLAVAAANYGLGPKQQRRIAAEAVHAYRRMMRDLARLSPFEVWQHRIDLMVELGRIDDKKLRTHIGESLNRLSSDEISNDDVPHLDPKSAAPRFEDRDGKIFHDHGPDSRALVAEAAAAFESYPAVLPPERRMLFDRYAHVDTAIKVVGVGSVGTLCAIGLYMTPDREMLVLQLKEAQTSVNIDLVKDPAEASTGDDDGRRVVEGQRALQAASDVFLTWIPLDAKVPKKAQTTPRRRFYVRHLKTQRLASLNDLIAKDIHEAAALTAYGQLCARTLARAHARTGDPVAIAAYLGSSDAFDEAIAEFACQYVGITEADHAGLVAYLQVPAGQGPTDQAAVDPQLA